MLVYATLVYAFKQKKLFFYFAYVYFANLSFIYYFILLYDSVSM